MASLFVCGNASCTPISRCWVGGRGPVDCCVPKYVCCVVRHVHLSGMEAVGISVDTGVLLQYSNVVGRRIREVEEAAHKVGVEDTISTRPL